MSGKPFTYEEVNYRLMAYKGTIYKFKIEFSSCHDGKNSMRGVLDPSQSRQIDRTVGVLVQEKFRGTGPTRALQTTDFLIRCSESPWKVVKKVGFRLRGKELEAYNQMLLLNVAPKQKRLTVVSRDRPNVRSTHSQGERGQGGAAKNGATGQSSSAQRGHDLKQQTSANQFEVEAQGPKPSSRQRCEQSSKQMERVSRLSPDKNLKKSSQNANLPRQQRISECSPRRQSPRSLLQEQSNVQAWRSQTVSPTQFYPSAKLSVQERSLKGHPDIPPRIFHGNSRFCQANAERGLPRESPVKCVTFQTSTMLHRSPRLCSVRSSESSPLTSPKRREIQDQLLLDPSKRKRCGRSIGPEGDTTVKQLRSDLRASSDVTATERLLHPLDREFVRREYEQEEMRLAKLAKPSTSSAERRAWLSSS